MTLRDEMERARPAIDGLNAAIRDNPLAAALIGAGVAWMCLGGSKGLRTIGSAGAQGMRAGGSAASSAVRGVAAVASDAAGGLKNVVQEVAGSVASIVPDAPQADSWSDATTRTTEAANQQWNSFASTARDYGTALQGRLSEGFERQPLLLGAIGLTIGAGIAAAFATTAAEGALMGASGTEARERLQGVVAQAKNTASEAMSEVRQAAEDEGLTSAAARHAANTLVGKARTVAGAARDTITDGVTQR